MATDIYRAQAALLVRALPFIATEKCFALKGGTAINLFVRDMPRLSVDIDLTYLPVEDRRESLESIEATLFRIQKRIEDGLNGTRVTHAQRQEHKVTALDVSNGPIRIKIEVNPVLRGTVFPIEVRAVSPRVENELGFAEMQVLSLSDLYAGKVVAALDRQHPRDLFDVRELFDNEGIDDRMRSAFTVYVISHSRPAAEILAPTPQDIAQEFARGFVGMTEKPVALADLIDARSRLIREVVGNMPEWHRRLLLSVERGEPDWPLLGIPGVERLPAVRWRLQNILSLTNAQRKSNEATLAKVLSFAST